MKPAFRITVFLLLAFAALTAHAADSARGLIEERSRVVLTALVDRRDEFRREPATMEAFVREELGKSFDSEYSARLVLGRHGRGVEAAKVVEFSDALTLGLMRRYGKAMLDFEPSTDVRILGETPLQGGKMVRVSSEILRATGSPVPVDYMLRPVDGGWRVFDVIVEGVSYVQTYRAQFEELLRTKTLDQVIAGLVADEIQVGG